MICETRARFKSSKSNRCPLNLLLIVWTRTGVTPKSVYEHINQIRSLSRFRIDCFNAENLVITTRFRKIKSFFKNPKIRLNQYDGIIIHNTIAYHPENVEQLEEYFNIPIEFFQGLKILMKQDEIFKTNRTIELMKRWKFDLLLTCVPPKDFHAIYASFQDLKKMYTLTGYVNHGLRQIAEVSRKTRGIDISYRGMKLPYHFGKLSNMKFEIAEKFHDFFKRYSQFKIDISTDLKDRIYGDAWIDFLLNSKATLAVESGASIYDFDGSIERETNRYLNENPHATFDEVFDAVLKPYDSIYLYNAVSPRHFEAAATRTVLIMPFGEYGGIFLPDRHYIPVKHDYSNLLEVLEKFKDETFCASLIKNAFEEIILNPAYGYEKFIETLDQQILDCFRNRSDC